MSYSSSHLGCQFEPSCSQYMALSIADYGVLRGVIVGSDRILRCNPAALTYHLEAVQPEFTTDGRMVDTVGYETADQPGKIPQLAFALSVIPGLGRAYAGHKFDGLISFTFISSFGYLSYNGFQNDQKIAPSVYGVIALTFWLADFYGAFRSASL
ncbi:MAG: membrane protein insertion efficiency factor YidD [FCB group bacterium]|nr:membrane protein insertion efficiency factor YidD [FCB group bacterium]